MQSISVGVISDTHGLLRAEALEALSGSDLILHAGDVGAQRVLDELGELAPVFAVWGNVDKGAWADGLPGVRRVTVGGSQLYVLHRLADLAFDPAEQGIAAVISGHSHRPGIESHDGVLYLNPGSAGPRRFRLPVAVGRLTVEGERVLGEIVTLDV